MYNCRYRCKKRRQHFFITIPWIYWFSSFRHNKIMFSKLIKLRKLFIYFNITLNCGINFRRLKKCLNSLCFCHWSWLFVSLRCRTTWFRNVRIINCMWLLFFFWFFVFLLFINNFFIFNQDILSISYTYSHWSLYFIFRWIFIITFVFFIFIINILMLICWQFFFFYFIFNLIFICFIYCILILFFIVNS